MSPCQDLDREFEGWADITMAQPTSRGTTHLRLHAGQIDEAAWDYFGHAYCHWLAGAVATMTGWRVATIDLDVGTGWLAVHSVVITPSGTALDIFGEHPSIQAVEAKYSRLNNDRPTQHRIVPTELMPGNTVADMDDQRGNPHWWNRDIGDKSGAIFQHFARLLLRNNGYGQHLPSEAPSGLTATPSVPAPYPAPSPAPAGTTTGGTAMSSIDEVRSTLAQSGEKSTRVLGALQQAVLEIEEIQQLLNQAVATSSQDSAQQAIGMYAQSKESLGELQGVIQAAMGSLDECAARL